MPLMVESRLNRIEGMIKAILTRLGRFERFINITEATGNVGIGTTGPNDKLDVAGGIRFGTASFTAGVGKLYTSASLGTVLTGNTGSTNDMTIASVAGQYLFTNPTGTNNTVLNPTQGNVGIGTASPTGRLHINGTSFGINLGLKVQGATYSAIHMVNDDSNANARNWGLYTPYTAYGNFEIRSSTSQGGDPSAAARLVINKDGNVGIGTASPGSKLSVVGLPTSSAGLSAGDIWVDTTGGLNILKIV